MVTTAGEYLKKLQSEVCQSYGISVQEFYKVETLGGKIGDLANEIVQRLGQGYAKLSRIPVGSLPIWYFNASIRAPEGFQIIVLNWGLQHILTSLTHSIVAGVESKTIMPIVETAIACSCAIKYGINAIKWPRLPNDISYKSSLNQLVTFQLAFVLCHEFAHSLLDHLNNASTVSFQLSDRVPKAVEYFTHEQNQEFDADKTAVDLLGKVFGSRKDVCYGAIYRLFRLMHLFEIMFPTDKPPVSHPPALDRWGKIQTLWQRGTGESDKEIGLSDFMATEKFFNQVDAIIIKAQEENPELLKAVWRK